VGDDGAENARRYFGSRVRLKLYLSDSGAVLESDARDTLWRCAMPIIQLQLDKYNFLAVGGPDENDGVHEDSPLGTGSKMHLGEHMGCHGGHINFWVNTGPASYFSLSCSQPACPLSVVIPDGTEIMTYRQLRTACQELIGKRAVQELTTEKETLLR